MFISWACSHVCCSSDVPMVATLRVLGRIRDAVLANFVVPRSPNCCLIEWKGSPWQAGIRVDQSLQRVGFGINPFVEAFIMPVQLHPPWKLAFFRRMNSECTEWCLASFGAFQLKVTAMVVLTTVPTAGTQFVKRTLCGIETPGTAAYASVVLRPRLFGSLLFGGLRNIRCLSIDRRCRCKTTSFRRICGDIGGVRH